MCVANYFSFLSLSPRKKKGNISFLFLFVVVIPTDRCVGGIKTLTADLHTLGYTHQLSVDFSHVVIQAMKLKYAALGGDTEWRVMDVRALEMGDASVDVAVDKGTLDAFLYGSLWDPPAEVRGNVGRYVDEVCTVYFLVSKWLL